MDLPEAVTAGKKPNYEVAICYRWGGRSGRPFHLHSIIWCIAKGDLDNKANYEYVDEGWKDTVLLIPGERIRILIDFEEYSGLFLYH
jgi:FtsP/CotA-like multicopper oxidase with cupredoxin domain